MLTYLSRVFLLTPFFLTACVTVPSDTTTLYEPLTPLVTSFLAFMPRLLAALVLFLLTLYVAQFLSRVLRRFMERRLVDDGITLLVFHIARTGIVLLGTILSLQQVDFDLTAFLTGLGILGFTVGFALQDISQNIVAGFLLLVNRPFEIGDMIEVQEYRGTVKSIDLRSTELHTLDGHNVLIPNASVFTNPIINYNRQSRWRMTVGVGVAYESDLEKVRLVTLQAIQAIPDVLADPAPDVVFHTFNEYSIDCDIRYWIDARLTNPFTATDPAIVAIHRAYEQAKIRIPYPIQVELQPEDE